MTITRKFGAAVAAARKRKNMTQLELAKKIGMNQGQLSRIESGDYHNSITNEMAERIASALGCSVHVLLK
jgi:transcriptional regulator with XRE-family HTH domain